MATESQIIITAVDRATSEIAKVRQAMEETAKSNQKSNDQLRTAATVAAGATAAYVVLKKGIIDSIAAFSQGQEVQQKLTSIILNHEGATMGDVKALISQAEAIQSTTVASKDLVVAAQAQLATFDLTPKSIQAIIPGLVDMTIAERGLNATSEDAKNMAQGLGKAFLGQYDSLLKQGFVITQAQRKMIEFGNETEKTTAIAEILGTTYEDVAKDMLGTFPGMVQFMKNNLGELQDSFGEGLAKSIQKSFSDIIGSFSDYQQSLESAKSWTVNFGYTSVQVFTLMARVAWNSLQNLASAAAGIVTTVISAAEDLGRSIGDSIKKGEWTPNFDQTKASWNGMVDDIMTNSTDIATAFSQFQNNIETGVTDPLKDANDELGKMPGNGSDAGDKLAKAMEKAAEKIKKLKEQMKDAISSAKKDIQDLKDSYEKEEKQKQSDLASSIASVIVEKNKERQQLNEDLKKAETETEKASIKEKLSAIDKFFADHQSDLAKYSGAIAEENYKASLDAVEILKYQYAQEAKERKADYDDKLKDLKSHLKEVKAEYKKKLQELKDEIKKDGLDEIKVNVLLSSSGSSSKKRAVGGSVIRGQEYTVGENGPETFIPDQSGRIETRGQSQSMQGAQYFSFDFRGATVESEERIVQMVQRALSRRNELASLGSQTL